MSKIIKVDVWSDIACPWCYIGKRKLENAIKEFSSQGGEVEVEYHSYQLNPEMPLDFQGSQRDHLATHKGLPLAQVDSMSEQIKGVAAAVDLHYDFDNQIITNTLLGHLLLHLAKSKGKQSEMKERLMSAHFVEGKHIGRIEVLADLAADVGLDRNEVIDVLENKHFLEDFKADLEQARSYGISGVPFFVLDDKYGISGAQDSTTFINAFQQIASEG